MEPPAWNAFAGRLTRPLYGRMLGGVCAGFAQAYGWDLTLVRLVVVLAFIFGCGTVGIAYGAAWIIMPNGFLMTRVDYPPYTAGPAGPQSYTAGTGSAPIS